MQNVSQSYKDSMASELRERAYIKVTFALRDEEAEENATFKTRDALYYSVKEVFDRNFSNGDYITFESHYNRLDGSMRALPPRRKFKMLPEYYKLVDTGFVSQNLFLSDYTIRIIFETEFYLHGIEINFGDNYPTYFTITDDKGTTKSYKNNSSIFSTDDEFINAKELTLNITQMKYPNNRVRVYSINFVYPLILGNDDISDSSFEKHLSPIYEDLPQENFSLTLLNLNNRFEPLSEFFDTDTIIKIDYGYTVPEDNPRIEWLTTGQVRGENYQKDQNNIIISGRDILQNSSEIDYYEGIYKQQSVLQLISNICERAGISNYIIDSAYANIYTVNPLPILNAKEALQIVVNAFKIKFEISRDGTLLFSYTNISGNAIAKNKIYYSSMDSVLSDSLKDEYIDFTKAHNLLDGSQKLPPPEHGVKYEPLRYKLANVGYISNSVSDISGYFDKNPVVIVNFTEFLSFNQLTFSFGSNPPANFIVRGYRGYDEVKNVVCGSNITPTYTLSSSFENITKLQIEFVKTQQPYERIILQNLKADDICDFQMTKNDMLENPIGETSTIKDITVYYYEYHKSSELENVYSGKVTVDQLYDEYVFYFDRPVAECYLINDITAWKLIEYGTYYVRVQALKIGLLDLEFEGYIYNITERSITSNLHKKGESVIWQNPLVASKKQAEELVAWLKDYYYENTVYNYPIRGNPELDLNDKIKQEDENVLVTDLSLTFNGAFGGNIITRRYV